MLDLALEKFPNMVSDDVEVLRQKASYTIDTLEHFRDQDPQVSIVLIIGSDIMSSFHRWHRYEDILNVANIVVMNRAGYEHEPAAVLKKFVTQNWEDLRNGAHGHVMLYPAPAIPISATKVREVLASQLPDGKHDLDHWLNPKVLTFIQQNDLYK
jgi:nicotinate-nucleotide adenylyltransferase